LTRSGNWIAFDEPTYGSDYELELVVGGEALASSPRTTVLKVRCSGDFFRMTATTARPPDD
jgi:hypothetical protein